MNTAPYPGTTPPPPKEGWDHSEQVLAFYPAVPELGMIDRWGIAYYHYKPPFAEPKWVSFSSSRDGFTPLWWWPLPALPK